MDEGLPISYEVLEPGVAVYASGGEPIGEVDHVIAAVEEDIFHGLVIRVGGAPRFVAAEHVASLHERGVDLRIDAVEVADLPAPEGAAPALRPREPGVKPSPWRHIVDLVSGRNPRRGDWREED